MKTITLIEIDFDELLNQIERIVERSLEKSHPKTKELIEERYLNQREAAEYLGISKPSFLKIKQHFPEYSLSQRRKGYLRRDLDEYVRRKKSI